MSETEFAIGCHCTDKGVCPFDPPDVLSYDTACNIIRNSSLDLYLLEREVGDWKKSKEEQ